MYLAFRFFFQKRVNWKFSSSFYHSIRWPWFHCLKSGVNIQLYRVFLPLDLRTGCFFHEVDEKTRPYTTFPVIRNEEQCLLFCDSTRIFMWSVPCLWLSHFVPCALVCVCVCQTLYLREINTFLQTDSPTRSSACPYNNSKTGGRSTLTSLLPTKTLVKRWWSWDWSSQCTCFFQVFPAFSNLFQNVSRE